MEDSLSRSELVLRQRALGRLKQRLFVETRGLSRELVKLGPNRRKEAERINSRIREVLLEAEQYETDLIRVQNQLSNSAAIDNVVGEGNSTVAADSDEKTVESTAARRDREKLEWTAKAMVLVQEHPAWSDAKIARQVGRDASQLSRSKTYQLAASLARGDRDSVSDGFIVKDKVSGTSDVEAYSDMPLEPDVDE